MLGRFADPKISTSPRRTYTGGGQTISALGSASSCACAMRAGHTDPITRSTASASITTRIPGRFMPRSFRWFRPPAGRCLRRERVNEFDQIIVTPGPFQASPRSPGLAAARSFGAPICGAPGLSQLVLKLLQLFAAGHHADHLFEGQLVLGERSQRATALQHGKAIPNRVSVVRIVR